MSVRLGLFGSFVRGDSRFVVAFDVVFDGVATPKIVARNDRCDGMLSRSANDK
jgi:hypothetical protein